MEQEKITTIRLKEAVKQELDTLGVKGDTYEDIIRRLIKHTKNHQEMKK